MTTVRFHTLSALGDARGLDRSPPGGGFAGDALPAGREREQETQRSLSQMDQSKIDAANVVLGRLTDYPEDHGDGALRRGTATGVSRRRRAVPGRRRRSRSTARRSDSGGRGLVGARCGPGQRKPITFDVDAAGETHEVTIARERCLPDVDEPIARDVKLIDAFPFDVKIASGDVGGPSAGLMWALGLYELMTPGDLTGGPHDRGDGDDRHATARVGPIGGIWDKVVAAQRAGADVFLVPADDMAELEGVDTGEMRLVSVATFQQALDALAQLGGQRGSRARVRPGRRPLAAFRTACVRLGRRSRCAAPGRDEHRHDAPSDMPANTRRWPIIVIGILVLLFIGSR